MVLRPAKVDSIDYEQEVLGIALHGAEYAKKVAKIPSDLFYYQQSRTIQKTIKMLTDQGKVVDELSLLAKLGTDYALPIAELAQRGLNPDLLHQRVNELKDIRFQHRVANIQPDTSMEELEELVRFYKPVVESNGVLTEDQMLEKVIRYHETGGIQTYSTGYDSLDDYYKIAKGQLCVVTGIPGHGKSTFIDNIVVNVVKKHGWKVCLFSPESFPIESHYTRLVEIYTGKTLLKYGNTRAMRLTESALEKYFREVYNSITLLQIPPEQRNLDSIMEKVTSDYDAFVVDPWNELEHQRNPDLTETEYIGETLMRLKAYAVFRDLHLWLVAHPRKMQRKDDGTYAVPEPYDISGSANWYNKADICMTVFREGNKSQVHIKKVRVRGTGKVTSNMAPSFYYDRETQQFREHEDPNDLPF